MRINTKNTTLIGKIIIVPYTFLVKRRIIFAFTGQGKVGFLYFKAHYKTSINKIIQNLPYGLKYLKERISAQLKRNIVGLWIKSLDDYTHVLGLPFDFDISIPRRFSGELSICSSFITLDYMRYIKPEFLALDTKSDIDEQIKTPYFFNLFDNYTPVIPEEISFDFIVSTIKEFTIVYNDFHYKEISPDLVTTVACDRIHILFVNKDTCQILCNSFDDSRYNFIGGSWEEVDTDILDTIIRECKEETQYIQLNKEDIYLLGKFFYCAEINHIVITMYAEGFEHLLNLCGKYEHRGRKENYGLKVITIDEFLSLDLGCFGPNSILFVHWFTKKYHDK